jgi:flagellar protein FliS
MFTAMNNPSAAYAKIGVETGVAAANPHQLILMLFDGALLALATASHAMQQGRIAERGQAISKAIDIITNGLKVSLSTDDSNKDTAGLAEKLSALYDYMASRLLTANLKSDKKIIAEVSGLLRELRGAWEEIARDPAVVSASRKLA